MSDRPQAANNLLLRLKALLNLAVDLEIISANPALGIRGYKIKSTGFHSWTEDEIATFERRHPIGTKARIAFCLLLYTAQRRGDVVQLGWQHVRDGRIALRQQKTGKHLRLKIHPTLARILNDLPRDNLTFILTEYGAPRTPAGFGNWFRERCNEAGLVHCSAHGLRKAAARRLAEVGNSAHAIMAVTGHTTLKEVERYTRDVDQARLADGAIASMPDGDKPEQKLSNLERRLDKREAK
jgi:integrase